MHDRLSQAFDNSGLTDTGFTDQHRVVLRATRQYLHDAFHLRLTTDHRIKLAFTCSLSQVATELLQNSGVRLTGVAHRVARYAHRLAVVPIALVTRQQLDNGLTHLRQVSSQLRQHLSCNALALFEQTEQQVLSANVVVTQLQCFTQRQLKDSLGTRRERNVTFDRLFALANNVDDRFTHLVALNVHHVEGFCCDALALGNEAQQQVLSADVVVVEVPGFVLCEDDDSPSSVGEPFEHGSS